MIKMMKKTLAALMAAILVLGTAGFSGFAVEAQAATVFSFSESGTVKKLVNDAAAKLVGANGKVYVSRELYDEIISKIGSNPTVSSVQRIFSRYVALNTSELPESARKVADSAKCKIINKNEVFIIVNIEENPELFDLITLCHTSAALLEKQNEFAAETGRDDLITNDYKGIAGELALHCAVYALTKAAGGANDSNPMNGHFTSAKEAELNRTETRGAALIRFFGNFLAAFYKLIGGTFGV